MSTINNYGHSTEDATLFARHTNDRCLDSGRMNQAEVFEAIDLLCEHLGVSIVRLNQKLELVEDE